jgi:hypothetical protein
MAIEKIFGCRYDKNEENIYVRYDFRCSNITGNDFFKNIH